MSLPRSMFYNRCQLCSERERITLHLLCPTKSSTPVITIAKTLWLHFSFTKFALPGASCIATLWLCYILCGMAFSLEHCYVLRLSCTFAASTRREAGRWLWMGTKGLRPHSSHLQNAGMWGNGARSWNRFRPPARLHLSVVAHWAVTECNERYVSWKNLFCLVFSILEGEEALQAEDSRHLWNPLSTKDYKLKDRSLLTPTKLDLHLQATCWGIN